MREGYGEVWKHANAEELHGFPVNSLRFLLYRRTDLIVSPTSGR